jgi:hypothetical protein
LGTGGAIEGRVLVADGRSPAGTIVGFSRGDGRASTVRVGEDGTFRVERLMPGPWLVQRMDAELRPNHSSASLDPGPPWNELPSSCIVHEGETTRFDLDLGAGDAAFVLAGLLSIDGAAPGAWTAALLEPVGGERHATVASAAVDLHGRFELRARAAGPTRLVLTARDADLAGLRLLATVELRGPRTEWGAALRRASVRWSVQGTPEVDGAPRALVCEPASGLRALLPVDAARVADGAVLGFLAGRARLVRFDESATEPDPLAWPALEQASIEPGATAVLRWR